MRLALSPWIGCWTLVAASSAAPTFAADAPAYVPAERQEVTVQAFVQPKYPSEALDRRQEGTVEVRGVVDPRTGRLRSVTYRPVEPGSAVFVESLEFAVPRWRLRPPTNDCVPTDEEVVIPVAFLIDGTTPRVTPVHDAKVSLSMGPIYRPVKRINPRWPTEMLRRNWTGIVYARLEISNDGKVTDVRTHTYSPDSADEESIAPFARIAVSALRKWEFLPLPEDYKEARVACYDIVFRLTDPQ